MTVAAAVKDLRKLHGLEPYNEPSNICWNDSAFGASLEKKHGATNLRKARAVLGLPDPDKPQKPFMPKNTHPATTSARFKAKEPSDSNTPKKEDIMSKDIGEAISTFLEKDLPQDKHLRLLAWQELHGLQKQLKKAEMELRKELTGAFFDIANAKEGTNTSDLGNGWKLKYKHKLDRKPDEAAFEAVFSRLPEGSKDSLIKFKPEVSIKAYRSLSETNRKIFEECLIIKPGSPELELVPPKEK